MKRLVALCIVLLVGLSVGSFAHGGHSHVEGENVFDHLKKDEKKAILIVNFGSTVDATREKTTDELKRVYTKEFKGFEVREAFTSREIISKLKKRGIEKENPLEAMDKLSKDGYTHLLIQPTNIMNGVESENLNNEISKYESKFEVVRVGTPLLTTTGDYKEVAKILAKDIKVPNGAASVLVGHGTHHYGGAAYAKLDYVFKSLGYSNFMVGTVEGFPTIDDVKAMLLAGGYKEVVLSPMMFVAGDHAMNDIAGDWKESLEDAGYKVILNLKGLGEYKDIQQKYIESTKKAMVTEKEDIAAKKEKLAKH